MPDPTKKFRKVGFIIPVIDGRIWLAQRGTEPYKGFYGAVGGKQEETGRILYDTSHTFKGLNDVNRSSIVDEVARTQGKELVSETSLREFCEEMFSNRKFPEDFSREDITNVYKLGFIVDSQASDPVYQNECYFHIAMIHRGDFFPSPREVTDFRDIRDINPERIFPLTRIALNHLEFTTNPNEGVLFEGLEPYKKFKLYKQIERWNNPEWEDEENMKFTGMYWAYAPGITPRERVSFFFSQLRYFLDSCGRAALEGILSKEESLCQQATIEGDQRLKNEETGKFVKMWREYTR